MSGERITIVECPRDAMQGIDAFIPTDIKVKYINSLLRCGFDTLDAGSFVSPKAIPQMADTGQVLKRLDLSDTASKILVIVANERGAAEAVAFDEVACLGFPFSVSETFQQRNTNAGIPEATTRALAIQNLCLKHNKQLVLYLSMAFGNPYGDEYHSDLVAKYLKIFADEGVKMISVADTVGLASAAEIGGLLKLLYAEFTSTGIGVHLHALPAGREQKLEAAWQAGCRRFDGAMRGIGGCPMSGSALVGNIDTEEMIRYFERTTRPIAPASASLQEAAEMAAEIFS